MTARSFTFNVSGLPTISTLPDQGIAEDTATAALPFIVGDAETPATSLGLSGSSSNPALVSTAGISFGGGGSNRTVTVRPLPNQFGAALITITVTDGSGNTAKSSFTLVVNPVNDPPTVSAIANQTINEDSTS